jgi:hypothetical protein
MRELVDRPRIDRFLRALGDEAREPGHVYLTGGATAVLYGWRSSTVDIDLKLVPDQDALLRAIPALKESLRINVELAAPDDFIPVRSTWQEQSPFIVQEGRLSVHHFDLNAQALAKIERGHAQDLADVRAMIDQGLVERRALADYFAAIEPNLYRYPAVDPGTFARAVRQVVGQVPGPFTSQH